MAYSSQHSAGWRIIKPSDQCFITCASLYNMASTSFSYQLFTLFACLRNWDRIPVRAIKRLISRAGIVSICPLLWQRDVTTNQTNQTLLHTFLVESFLYIGLPFDVLLSLSPNKAHTYYIRQRSWANVMYSPLFVCLLLCKIVDFCKVYWSPRFVTFRNLRFSESILVTAVCLFVCLSVCLSVCPSSKALQAAPLVRSSWFFAEDVFWTRDNAELFFFKIG